MTPAQSLADGITRLGLVVEPAAQQRLLAYLELIVKWNRVHNLTAIRDLPSMVSAHLLDSLAVAPHLQATNVLDIGSGGGLPGIPLAIVWPQACITVLDSNQKKTSFLQQAKIELALDNVEVVCARAEDWQAPQPFDLVISRAFSELAEFVRLGARFCKPDGVLAAMKAAQTQEEIARLPAGSKVKQVLALHVPELNAERHLVLLAP
jgi:16S rRNA (guanine527-N7)-methyltransferase